MADPTVFGFATSTQVLAGFILCRLAADEAEVLSFGISPGHRRRGYGRRLLSIAKEDARQRGARCIFVDVAEDNTPAQALYDQAGFFRVGRREAYYRDARVPALAGTAALVLRCDLCDAASRRNIPETERRGANAGQIRAAEQN